MPASLYSQRIFITHRIFNISLLSKTSPLSYMAVKRHSESHFFDSCAGGRQLFLVRRYAVALNIPFGSNAWYFSDAQRAVPLFSDSKDPPRVKKLYQASGAVYVHARGEYSSTHLPGFIILNLSIIFLLLFQMVD